MNELLEQLTIENNLLQGLILSFRKELDNTIYCDLLEDYDKHFNIKTVRQGYIDFKDLK